MTNQGGKKCGNVYKSTCLYCTHINQFPVLNLPHLSDPSVHLIFSLSDAHPFPEKGLFILESEPLKRCITVDRSNLVLEDCGRPTRHMLWKWVSRHRLFNLGTSTCLGLNISDSVQPLGTFECDMSLPVLWWRCSGNMLYGASQWKVAVAGRLVVVKKTSHHEWKRYNTPGEGPCSYPYEGKQLKRCTYFLSYLLSWVYFVFYLQISTLCWETRMACPVHCPLNTTTNGTLSARLRGSKTTSSGVLPPPATMRLKDGASVQFKVMDVDTQTVRNLNLRDLNS